MRRFVAPDLDLSGNAVQIEGALFRHIARVLRLKIGTPLVLADGSGGECRGIIREIGRSSLLVGIEERVIPATSADEVWVTLFQGLPKGDKMELILQKCTELGASEVIPFQSARSVSRVAGERMEEKVCRWRRIAVEAARQAGRRTVPEVRFAATLAEALRTADQELKLLLWEAEETVTLKKVLSAAAAPARIAIIVGPEGGISPDEAAVAISAGFTPVTLGKRILRTETAGLAAMAILQYEFGDLGNAREESEMTKPARPAAEKKP